MDLHNHFHFIKLRLVKQVVPIAYEAFTDFSLHSKLFSIMEIVFFKKIVDAKKVNEKELLDFGLSKQEAVEMIELFKNFLYKY